MYAHRLSPVSPTPARESQRSPPPRPQSPSATPDGAPISIGNAAPLPMPPLEGSAQHDPMLRTLLGGGVLLISPRRAGGGEQTRVPAGEHPPSAAVQEHADPALSMAVADAFLSGHQLKESWRTMLAGWADNAVTRLCSKVDAVAAGMPREQVRARFVQVVEDSLRKDLDEICGAAHRIEAFGLNEPLPPAMQAALAYAMQVEIDADALLDPGAQVRDEATRSRVLSLLGEPAIVVLRDPALRPLFEALHRA